MELGSGVGMLGITLLKTVAVQSYTFTDCHESVLNFLAHNLQQNYVEVTTNEVLTFRRNCMKVGPRPVFKSATSFHCNIKNADDSSIVASVERLDWTKPPCISRGRYDVVLGSDIVYERSLIEPLCKVLSSFLVKDQTVAYIACTQRSQTTLQCFEDQMKLKQLNFEIIAKGAFSPTENLLCSDVQHQPTRIYEIKATL